MRIRMNAVLSKKLTLLTALFMVFALVLVSPAALGENTATFAGGDGTADSPYQIATAEQLDSVRSSLDSHFILTADLDLSVYESWEPIGAYVPSDMNAGDFTANERLAFSGSFNGGGHTISNLTITRTALAMEDMTGTGLFGCIGGDASIQNLNIENATVTSSGNCAAALVGMAMSSNENAIQDITLTGANLVSSSGSVAGIVGSAQDTNIINCSAVADVVMTSAGNGAGIVGGGVEGGKISGCSASGMVTATGTMVYEGTTTGSIGIGGLAGCAFDTREVVDCKAEDVTIVVGENSSMIGGLLGYSGIVNEGAFTSDPEGFTRIRNCQAVNVIITASVGASRIGGIVGSGFTGSNYIAYYPASSAIH
nr:hypothetical protein [Clostridia bacterium]